MATKEAMISLSTTTTQDNEKKKSTHGVTVKEISPSTFLSQPHSGRRKAAIAEAAAQSYVGYDGEEDKIKWAGKIYKKILSLNIVLRFAIYILPVAFILAIPLIVCATAARNVYAGKTRLIGIFVWLEVLWCGVWIAKLLAKVPPYIFRFFCGILNAGVRKHALMFEALEDIIAGVFLVIIAWATVPIMSAFNDSSRSQTSDWIGIFRTVLLAAIPCTCVHLIEKTFIQLITVSYHRRQFSANIGESKHMVSLLELLYNASVQTFPPYCPEFLEEDTLIDNSMMSASWVKDQILPTTSPILRFDNLGRLGAELAAITGHKSSEKTSKQASLLETPAHKVVILALEHKTSAEALARRLWMSFVEEDKESLYQHDIERILGSDSIEEAEKIFSSFDKDRNGDISLNEMIMMVEEIRIGRKSVAKSMYDVDMAISCLDQVLLVVVLVLVALIYAAFFSRNFLKNLTFLTTSILSLSFAFAVTVQEFTGSCIFLFVKHPYDVGDRVDINSTQLIVEHIDLLYTVFRRVDTNKKVQIPNIVNNSNWIENISRSEAMKEQVSISINASTSFDDINLLRDELHTFVMAPENKRDFSPNIALDVFSIGDMKQLELRVEVTHKSNWSNENLRLIRRAKFMTALVSSLRKVPIYAPGAGDATLGDAARPTYSVTVTDDEAKVAREKYAGEKEAKRFKPSSGSKAGGADGEGSPFMGAAAAETVVSSSIAAVGLFPTPRRTGTLKPTSAGG